MISIPVFIFINVVALIAGYAYNEYKHQDEPEDSQGREVPTDSRREKQAKKL